MTLDWPTDKPLIRVTFDDFIRLGPTAGKASSYVMDLQVENISEAAFPSSDLALVFYDKGNAIVGNATLYIGQRLEPHQKLKQQINFVALDKPVRLNLGVKDIALSQNHRTVARTVSMTVRSLPEGAEIDIDGQQLGVTPKVLRVPVGAHLLILTKAGYGKSDYPFEVRPEDSNGGSVEVELPVSSDILEMRDGSTITGDIENMSWESVRLMTGDKRVDYPRNLVKRIILVPRIVPEKSAQPTEAPKAETPKAVK